MGFFKKKTRVTPEAFIADQAQESMSQRRDDLKGLFAASKTEVLSDLELATFSAFMPLLAMSMARLNDNIVRGYAAQTASLLEGRYGDGAGDDFKERTLEYLAAFDEDLAENKAHLTPTTITIALNNIIGKSDESVVLCRMGLVKTILPILNIEIDFFKELKFI